jgi:hypothetical protein
MVGDDFGLGLGVGPGAGATLGWALIYPYCT